MDTGKHPVPYDSRDQFIYDREQLMSLHLPRRFERETENPRLEPGEEGHPGVTREHVH
jgi:NADH-quinone oxidoreductase subunit I